MQRAIVPFLCLVAALAGCGHPEASFSTKFASGFAPASHAVSVLGVFKDGQMSAEAWDAVSARVSPALGAPGAAQCESGYVDAAGATTNAKLWTAVDDFTRASGPTDDLLAQLAPAAKGDLVLVLTVAGKLPSQAKIAVQDETGTGPGAGAGAGGGQRMGAGSLNGMRNKGQMFRQHTGPGANDALDLSALIFSVSSGRSVGRIALEYTGTSVDEAISKFAAKIHESLPAASCTGWSWEGEVDPERIKAIEP